jgi:hypothetical protein
MLFIAYTLFLLSLKEGDMFSVGSLKESYPQSEDPIR